MQGGREPGLCSHRELLGGRCTGKASLGGSEGQRTPAQRQGDAHGRAAGAGGPCGCHAAAGPVQAEFARQLRPAGSEPNLCRLCWETRSLAAGKDP